MAAPIFLTASPEIPDEGVTGKLVWWGRCDEMLDCTACPPEVVPGYEAPLRGAILLYNPQEDIRLFTCGLNTIARGLEPVGLAGMAEYFEALSGTVLHNPGYTRNRRMVGDKHLDGTKISFPHVELPHYTIATSGLVTELKKGASINGTLTRKAPNPWLQMFCGWWIPFQPPLVIAHLFVAERAATYLMSHVQAVGIRFDMAQLALCTETLAHLLLAPVFVDPFFAFHFKQMKQFVFQVR